VHPASSASTHKIKDETIFSKNGYGTYHTQKFVILLKCDNVIENIQIQMSSQVFFFFFWFEIFNECEISV